MADEPEGRNDRDEQAELREVALRSLIANMVGLGVQLGIIILIAKRDSLWRAWRRYQWHVFQEWRGARERKLIAELRQDISRIEHGDSGGRGAAGRSGLYGDLGGD